MIKFRLFLFIAKYYIKYFMVIFIALGLFFVSIDSLQYIDQLADSANIIILFLAYDFAYAINFTLPISLILSLIICYLFLVKSNQYTAFLALGFSKKQILRPFLLIISFFTFIYIGLNFTPFAYAQEESQKLLQKDSTFITKDLFIKLDNNYAIFGSINPAIAQAQNIKVFTLKGEKDNKILDIYTDSPSGYFDFNNKNAWIINNANEVILPKIWGLKEKGIETNKILNKEILNGFRPKVLDSIYQSKPLISIIDAIETLKILYSQNAPTDKIRAVLYSLVLIPLFVPLVALINAFYMPSLARYENLYLLGFKIIVFSLIVWGLLFSLSQFAITGIVNPEFGVVIPMIILLLVSIVYYFKLNRSS